MRVNSQMFVIFIVCVFENDFVENFKMLCHQNCKHLIFEQVCCVRMKQKENNDKVKMIFWFGCYYSTQTLQFGNICN